MLAMTAKNFMCIHYLVIWCTVVLSIFTE